jgi:hypothetical protein
MGFIITMANNVSPIVTRDNKFPADGGLSLEGNAGYSYVFPDLDVYVLRIDDYRYKHVLIRFNTDAPTFAAPNTHVVITASVPVVLPRGKAGAAEMDKVKYQIGFVDLDTVYGRDVMGRFGYYIRPCTSIYQLYHDTM